MGPLGIVCAVDTEYLPFLMKMSNTESCDIGKIPIYHGILEGKEVYLAFSGIAKANAALTTALLIQHYGCTHIINSGTAGALSAEAKIGEIVVSNVAAYHDIEPSFMSDDARIFPDSWFQASTALLKAVRTVATSNEQRIHIGLVATGETFIDAGSHDEIFARLHPISADMETAAVAHACFLLGAEFIAIRGITDTPEYPGFDVYLENKETAAARAADFVQRMLALL